MKKRLLVLFVLALLAVTTVTVVSAQDDTPLIIYSIPDASNPFLSNLSTRVQQYFALDGVEVQIVDAQGDPQRQYNQIETAVTLNPDLIILLAIDPLGLQSAIEQAQAAGIPVLAAGGDTIAHDGFMHTDQTEMGRLIAQLGCEWLGATFPDAAAGSVQVGIIENRDTPEAVQRSDGMAAYLTEACPAAAIAGVVGGQPIITFGATAAENLLTAHPEIKLILAYNDAQGLGAAQTVTANASIDPTQFGIFGADGTPDGVAAITSGSPFRGSVRIGGPQPLDLDTYTYASLMLSGGAYPAEWLDNLTPLTAETLATASGGVDLAGMTVLYAIPDASNPFLSNLSTKVQQLFSVDGVEVQIVDAQGDPQRQYNQIETAITTQPDLIILLAIDPLGLQSAIEQAQAAGIPVMAAGGDTIAHDAFMHTDQHQMGVLETEMACAWIAQTFPDAAPDSVQVGIIENRDTPEAVQRSDALATIDASCPAAEVVGVVGGQPVITFGATAAENLLTAHPEIKVILAYNDAQGLGALQTVTANAAINPDQFAIYGADGTPDGVAAITSGSPFRGSVRIGGPNPLHLDTYRYARLILSGSPYPAEMLDNLTALTIDNAQ